MTRAAHHLANPARRFSEPCRKSFGSDVLLVEIVRNRHDDKKETNCPSLSISKKDFLSRSIPARVCQNADMSESLHIYLKEWRKIRDLTQKALAEKADVDVTYISKVERGLRDGMSTKFLNAVARAMKCRPKDLFENPMAEDLDLDLLSVIEMWADLSAPKRQAAKAMIRGLAEDGTQDPHPDDLKRPA